MKWFDVNEISNVNELRSIYKKLLIKYHPDNNSEDTTSIMQEINMEYDILFQRLKDVFEHEESYEYSSDKTKQSYDWENDKKIREMVTILSKFEGITIEIIGVWIWVSECYEYRKELKELGFHWAKQKKMWYIHFDKYHKFGSRPMDMNFIRNKYGSFEMHTKKEHEDMRLKA